MKLLEKLRGLFGPRKKPGRPAGAKKPAPQKKPLKIAGPDAKLTAAEKRRVKRSIQKAQRDGKIPRDAVQTIPYRELFPDGLMQVNDKLFTKTLRFSDINYELAQPEDKEQTFDGLCDFYNALDSSMWAQMSFLNLRANLIDYRKSVTVPGQGDGCDDVRRELETILQAQLAKGNNGLIKRKYFTFGIEADSGQAARPRVERIERKGLGTPATRAGIIEKLVKTGFVERKAKQLLPTPKGAALIGVLPELIKSPALTAEWEHKLKQVERGELDAADFMAGIAGLSSQLVQDYGKLPEGADLSLFQPVRKAVGTCPRCGGRVVEGKKGFTCENRDCGFALWKENRFFKAKKKELTAKIAAALLKEGRAALPGCHSEKTGKTYDAIVILDDTGGKFVGFKLDFPAGK